MKTKSMRLLTAFGMAIAAGLGVQAANVISINFTDGTAGNVPADETVVPNLADDALPGYAWNNLGSGSKPANVPIVWNGSATNELSGVSVTWDAKNWWGITDQGSSTKFFQRYLDDGEHNGIHGPTIKVTGIPYEKYDVIVYTATDTAPNGFRPVQVNGKTYTYAGGQTVEGTTNWGNRNPQTAKAGVNALRMDGIRGDLTVQGGKSQGNARGCIAAIQIVERVDEYPAADFKWLIKRAPSSGWFTKNNDLGNSFMPGPFGYNIYVTGGKPWVDFTIPTEFTFSGVFYLDYVTATDKPQVVWALGSKHSNALALAVKNGKIQLLRYDTGSDGKVAATCETDLTPGFHVISATYSATAGKIALKVDNKDTVSVDVGLAEMFGGMQLGSVHGGIPDEFTQCHTAAIERLLGWSKVLTEEEMLQVYAAYADFGKEPFAVHYDDGQDGVRDNSKKMLLPDCSMDKALKATYGTMWIGKGKTVSAPSLMLANDGYTDSRVIAQIDGTLNVTAVSSSIDAYNDRESNKGILLSHYYGSGVYNVRGQLIGEGAYLMPAFSCPNEGVNIDGADALVKVRGVYKREGGAFTGFNLTNGGTLEVADFPSGGGALPVNVTEGKLRAYSWNNSAGWTLPANSIVTVTNTANGLTIDPNGLRAVIAAAPAGSGNIKVSDSKSANKGTTRFETLAGFAGAVSVDSGTLELPSLEVVDEGKTVTVNNGGILHLVSPTNFSAAKLTMAGGKVRLTTLEGLEGADSLTWNSGILDLTGLTNATYNGTISATGGAIELGALRPTQSFSFSNNAELILVESSADSNNVVALTFTGDPAVKIYRANGTRIDPDDVKIVETNGTKQITYPMADPDHNLSGEACNWDFPFDNRSLASVGAVKESFSRDTTDGMGAISGGQNGDFKDDTSLYVASQVNMSPSFSNKWTAVVYGSIPENTHSAMIAFGKREENGFIALAAGDTAKNEVLLVHSNPNARFTTLASITVPNAYASQHLWVLVKSANDVKLYVDGILRATHNGSITISSGIQVGRPWGGVGSTGLVAFNPALFGGNVNEPKLQAATIDMLRIFNDRVLTAAEIAALATGYAYIPPAGLYARTLTGDANWTAENAWRKFLVGADFETVNAPAENSAVEITATQASTLTIGAAGENTALTIESLAIGGEGAVTLKTAEGVTLVNTANTIVKGTLTIPPTVSVAGGITVVADGAKLKFDYSSFKLDPLAPIGSIPLTGEMAEATDKVECTLPTDTSERAFTFAYNSEAKRYELTHTRTARTLVWNGSAAWSAENAWQNLASSAAATFIAGDNVVFGALAGKTAETVTVPATQVGALIFSNALNNASATAYVLNGEALTAASISSLSGCAVAVSNTLNVSGAPLYVQSAAAPAEFADLRGSLGAVQLTAGTAQQGSLALGTAGALTLGGETTIGANNKLTITGSGTITQSGSLHVDPAAAVHKTGSGAYVLNSAATGSRALKGTLEVSEGRFEVTEVFNQVTATAANPIKVNGTGHLYIRCPSGAHAINRLPNQAYVEVSDSGVFQVRGNNPFPYDGNNARVTCRNGGTLQVDGNSSSDYICVNSLTLDSGKLHLAGTAANYASVGVKVTTGIITSTGESQITIQDGCPNRMELPGSNSQFRVSSGTLTIAAPLNGTVVKTGEGRLKLEGSKGGASNGQIEIREGALVWTPSLFQSSFRNKLKFAQDAALDISEATGPASVSDFASKTDGFTVERRLKIVTGERDIQPGQKLLAWESGKPVSAHFRLVSAKPGNLRLVARDDGLYAEESGLLIMIR